MGVHLDRLVLLRHLPGPLERPARLLLPLRVSASEVVALDEYDLSARDWVTRLKGPAETDAEFLARRFAALPMSDTAAERLWDDMDAPMRLAPGPGSPFARAGGWPWARFSVTRAGGGISRKPLLRERATGGSDAIRPLNRIFRSSDSAQSSAVWPSASTGHPSSAATRYSARWRASAAWDAGSSNTATYG